MSDPRYIEAVVDDWRGLYKDSWTGVIVPESFAHPAKYSRALIRFIYQHVIECGWIHGQETIRASNNLVKYIQCRTDLNSALTAENRLDIHVASSAQAPTPEPQDWREEPLASARPATAHSALLSTTQRCTAPQNAFTTESKIDSSLSAPAVLPSPVDQAARESSAPDRATKRPSLETSEKQASLAGQQSLPRAIHESLAPLTGNGAAELTSSITESSGKKSAKRSGKKLAAANGAEPQTSCKSTTKSPSAIPATTAEPTWRLCALPVTDELISYLIESSASSALIGNLKQQEIGQAITLRLPDGLSAGQPIIVEGSGVVDPFGGVALGGLDAMRHGLHFVGCELEEKFVGLGNQNIALWNDRYSRMPNWGSAQLLNGDSRKLADVIAEARLTVSSPPYAVEALGHRGAGNEIDKRKGLHARCSDNQYGAAEGQLGAMKEGDLQCAISSPPYARSLMPDMNDPEKYAASEARYKENHPEHKRPKGAAMIYGNTPGNLGHIPEGNVEDAMAMAITSPPYNPPMSQDHNGSRGGQRGTTPSEKGAFVKYGNSEGQLEGMAMEGFDAAISSPPYEGTKGHPSLGHPELNQGGGNILQRATTGNQSGNEWYGQTEGQIQKDGETFWSASRTILEQLHQVLAPNAHAIFVVKSFVRNKQIVDFPAQWAQLCEPVGFRLIHDHHALLTEEYGEQHRLDGGTDLKTVARKSFFRRLAESKGSPKIDYENVLCFEKRP